MRPVSENFLNTIRGSHTAVFRVRVVNPGLTGVNPASLGDLEVQRGNVWFDTRADVNGTVDIITSMQFPTSADSIGAPYGQELYVERGVEYGSGTREWVGLGYFRIDSIWQSDSANNFVRVSGSDRMANVRDARPLAPTVYTAGTSVGDVVDDVVSEAYPGVVTSYDWDAYAEDLASDHVLSDDRIRFLRELLTSFGKVFYFDYAGRFVAKTQPTAADTTVYTINAGRNGVLCSMDRNVSREGVYNAVVATGESIGELPPVRAVAIDEDPTSPTYFNGPFGPVPRFFSSSFMTTEGQCQGAANALLAQSKGLPYVVEMGVVPNPALEGWDVVRVEFSDQLSPETHILDTITYSLSVDDPMILTSRKQFLE